MSGNLNETIVAYDDGEQPPKRQRTLSKACEVCKVKKSRCDSARPQCESCRKKGLQCIYKEKGQPGLRPGYGKGVENRLTLLEECMARMEKSMQEALGAQTTLPTGTPAPIVFQADEEPLRSEPTDEPQAWPLLQQPPEVVSIHSTAPSVMERPEVPSIAELSTDKGLPPSDVLQELAELFFEVAYPWARLFYKPKFMATLFLPERYLLLHGIVVVALRFWRKTYPSAEMQDAFMKASREKILLECVDSCTLISTQALALLAVDAIGHGPGTRAWNITAMLVTAVPQLGLARSSRPRSPETTVSMVQNEAPDDGWDTSSIEIEEKRRLFWMIYSLDLFSSVSNGQPGGIDTRSINLQFPCNDEDWGQTVAADWFRVMVPARPVQSQYSTSLWRFEIDLLALLDRSNQLLIQRINMSSPAQCQEWQSSFRLLGITLSTWFETLPGETRKLPDDFNPVALMVHATYYLINLRMHTVAAFPSVTSPYLKPSASAKARCRQDIQNVVSLTNRVQSYQLDHLGPIFAFIVWVAARSLIILWTTGYEHTYRSMPADLEALLGVLRQMCPRWKCAQRYVDILQFILDTRNGPDGSVGLSIFNDTRRTAYGLQKFLGDQAGRRTVKDLDWFDFTDVPGLDDGGLTAQIDNWCQAQDGEWL